MAVMIFQKIAKDGMKAGFNTPQQSQASRDWYRQKANSIMMVNRQKMMQEGKDHSVKNPWVGGVYMFFYDAKHKKDLPYYDTFPVIIPISEDSTSFTGLNLHYLPYVQRAMLMDALYTNLKMYKNPMERLKVNYKILKGASQFKWFKPCVHKYLKTHVYQNIVEIDYQHWDMALFLPVENFVSQNVKNRVSKQTVWDDSLKRIK